ncbi:hypothetical protein FAIPA1_10333 [Frankia sp. AiPs1]
MCLIKRPTTWNGTARDSWCHSGPATSRRGMRRTDQSAPCAYPAGRSQIQALTHLVSAPCGGVGGAAGATMGLLARLGRRTTPVSIVAPIGQDLTSLAGKGKNANRRDRSAHPTVSSRSSMDLAINNSGPLECDFRGA